MRQSFQTIAFTLFLLTSSFTWSAGGEQGVTSTLIETDPVEAGPCFNPATAADRPVCTYAAGVLNTIQWQMQTALDRQGDIVFIPKSDTFAVVFDAAVHKGLCSEEVFGMIDPTTMFYDYLTERCLFHEAGIAVSLVRYQDGKLVPYGRPMSGKLMTQMVSNDVSDVDARQWDAIRSMHADVKVIEERVNSVELAKLHEVLSQVWLGEILARQDECGYTLEPENPAQVYGYATYCRIAAEESMK